MLRATLAAQVAEIALRIDRERGNAVDRGFFEQREAEARLAAAGHADADRVRRQILRVVEQRRIRWRAVRAKQAGGIHREACAGQGKSRGRALASSTELDSSR
jgi:hypothetical protein